MFRRGIAAGILLACIWAAPSAHAAFPGNDGLITFASFPRTSTPYEEVYLIKPSGAGLTRLTDRAGRRQSSVFPDWDATAKRIAYQRSTPTDSRVLIIKPGTGHVVGSFGDGSCAGGIGMPSWAPNGTSLAYICFDGASGDYLKTYDLVSGVRKQITPAGGHDRTPEFSPAGGAIAYARELSGGASYQVVIAYLNGSGDFDHEEIVAGDLTTAALDPDWTPDALNLVYACAPAAPPSDQDLCSAPVTAPHTLVTLVNGPNYEQFPAVSPDGDEIVWDVGPEKGDTELKRRLISGGPVTTLTANRVVDEEADWGVRP